MNNYIIKRLLLTIPTVFGVVTLVFLVIHFIPGDPVEIMLGETASQTDKAKLRADLGLDLPIFTQYLGFLSNLFQGNLGTSFHFRQPAFELIMKRLPATIELSLGALAVALIISIPLGIFSAVKQYSYVDQGSLFLALIGVSMPNFWLGPILIIVFSIHLGWLPVSGRGDIYNLILPAITLGASMAAILTRMIRSSLLDTLKEEYIKTARAKGLPEPIILLKHALRNALLPVVTILGLQFGSLLAGSIITETIFSWPGIGRLTIQAIVSRDYPLVQACVMVVALGYVFINLLTDLMYAWIDPRIKYE
ncbi:MAG TPA: nickel ABC transporter permease [Nitrospinota bacterium]|jgi:peptide/nickel transport system permease protein|nr:nickel ABC transporter permease [Nitrospinota bacterium]